MGDFCYFLVVLTEANSEFQNKLFGDYPNNFRTNYLVIIRISRIFASDYENQSPTHNKCAVSRHCDGEDTFAH